MKFQLFIVLWLASVLLSSLLLTSPVSAQASAHPSTIATANELPLYSKVYDDKRDPFKDAQAAIGIAQASNRNVLIEIGGNWCTWCHKMDAFLAKNPKIYQTLHDNYVLLKISVSDSNENEAFMKSLPPVQGYPHMYVSTNTGQMLLSKDTAELLDDLQYSAQYWLTFLAKWQVKNNKENLNDASAKG
ncbi:thioredoxin family protein [Colwellia sp. MB02u-9]|uniref:thioredoxin family protein n=1 Tax=Colwellia sp. MB02u-9 TaxID=2759823 RepID=UPI0015F730CF|nr:thioredoxin family protein [Colwellia sp. MB02u-9]MBA6295650.1 thioredoxin family protein [Colwellia sp. MB02u-9]